MGPGIKGVTRILDSHHFKNSNPYDKGYVADVFGLPDAASITPDLIQSLEDLVQAVKVGSIRKACKAVSAVVYVFSDAAADVKEGVLKIGSLTGHFLENE